MNFKLLQKLLFFMVLGLSLFNLQSCSEVEEPIEDVTDDYGKISGNSLVATGGYRDVKPLKATILASIKTIYQGAYTSLGVEFTPNTPDFNSSETSSVRSKTGVTNGHFETVLSYGDAGALEPGTTYYYRAYAYMAGTKYNGEVRSFVTPDLQVSKTNLVDLGVSVKWASNNMGANAPEIAGTALQQCYAFENFNNDRWDEVVLLDCFYTDKPSYFPDNVDDYNWLGTRDYDVVTRTMGSGYRIPTEDEWRELEERCYWKNGVYNGVKGFYISDRVDGTNVIFLPYIKKSPKHDITVYLSAPDDIIRNLKKVMDIEKEYLKDMMNPNLSSKELRNISIEFFRDRLDIEMEFGQGEVLTETSHIFNDDGLILRPKELNIASVLNDDDLSWTHPTTGKTYNFYKEIDTYGGGVLYVRPVSNSNR